MIKRSSSRGRPGSIRVIGGRWRGRRIGVGDAAALRPTPNRVRETLFNWLAPFIEGARCLDLFAGSGVLGIEALSRGAAEISFVESDLRTVRELRATLDRFAADALVFHGSAADFLARYAGPPFDVVFLDAPYDTSLDELLAALERHVARAGLVYVERASASGLPQLAWAMWHKRGQAAAVCFGLAARA